MMKLLVLGLVALLVVVAQARTSSHLMWETSNAPSHEIYGWTQGKRANPDELVKMTVAVKQQNTDHITKLLEQVSDPKSPQYGKYLSMTQVGDIIRPTPEAISSVSSWLLELGCMRVTFAPNSNWAKCVTKVGAVERAIPSTKFYVFEHKHRSKPLIRSMGSFEVAVEVASHCDIISGISDFPPVRQRKEHPVSSPQDDDWSFRPSGGDSTMSVFVHYPDSLETPQTFVLIVEQELSNVTFTFDASSVKVGDNSYNLNALGLMNSHAQVTLNVTTSSGEVSSKSYESPVAVSPWVTASLVRSLYDIPVGLVSQFPNNSQAVAEFDDQYYSPSDLEKFTQLMGIPLPEVDLQGSNDASQPGVESTLDIQWIITTGSNVTTTFWYVESGFLTEWALEVSSDPNPPLVHSISYGEPETVVTSDTLDRLNSEFQQLGLRGVTIISTSGDVGVSDGFPRGCNSDTPDFPSSSPWTTSLGAVALARDYTTPFCSNQEILGSPIVCAFNAEVPCSAATGQGFTTGGGFSYKNPQPSYQTDVVTQYLNTSSSVPPSSWFNSAGRGFNDVTALGSNIVIIYNGSYAVTGGTSASGPIVAGLLALINDSLLQAGKAPLGFANPFLYTTATDDQYVGAFNPITIGDNKCKELGADGAATCCEYGFSSSSTVWDPVNGLGSPNFQTLRRAALDYQS